MFYAAIVYGSSLFDAAIFDGNSSTAMKNCKI
jgi:hypothetical protein